MARLLIHVEGQTEETFVKKLLEPHLYTIGYQSIGARLIGNARQRNRRGGICSWSSASHDILAHLREDAGVIVTTMVDYYGLPGSGPGAWPGRDQAATLAFDQKAEKVESSLLANIQRSMDQNFNINRFIPFVMMHEFEGLLFSDCEQFAAGIGRPDLTSKFQNIRDQFSTPEEINDSPDTAPSKRVQKLVVGYQKPYLGNLAALKIGLEKIRAECPHFHQWLERLESLAPLKMA